MSDAELKIDVKVDFDLVWNGIKPGITLKFALGNYNLILIICEQL